MNDYINTVIEGDCNAGLKLLADKSVHCCVSSPPYYKMRNYGVDGQIGLEETPEEYVQALVQTFREVKRILRDDGTLWLNIGDSYASSGKNRTPEQAAKNSGLQGSKKSQMQNLIQQNKITDGLKAKDLIGIPWMLAFALRADGWYLRQDIIWHKPNPMPESVKDRCTKAHEYIFLLSKSAKYYYDHKAIMQECKNAEDDYRRINQQVDSNKYIPDEMRNGLRPRSSWNGSSFDTGKTGEMKRTQGGQKSGNIERKPASERGVPVGGGHVCASVPWEGTKANKRSVWTVTTQPFKEAHFATFPQELIVDCIKAGCPVGGIVLDPFMGAGTTAIVARKLERNYIGCELNPEYIGFYKKRIAKELGIFQ